MKNFVKIILLSIYLSLCFCSCTKEKKIVNQKTVRIGIQPSAAFIPLYIARYTGLIETALKDDKITVIWQDFESGPPMNESLSADMTDIGVIGDVPTVTALSNTNSTSMKMVGVPARGANAYAMLSLKNNDTFNSSKDMKGKKIATVFGSTGHNFTTKLLAKNTLTFNDIDFLSISASDAEAALVTGLADAVVIWEPNITRLIDKNIAKIIAYGDETGLKGTNAFVVREEYLLENKPVIQTILSEYQKAASMLDELNDETIEKVSLALKITREQLFKISKIYDFNVNITQEDEEALQDTISFLVTIGNLTTPYPIQAKTVKDMF